MECRGISVEDSPIEDERQEPLPACCGGLGTSASMQRRMVPLKINSRNLCQQDEENGVIKDERQQPPPTWRRCRQVANILVASDGFWIMRVRRGSVQPKTYSALRHRFQRIKGRRRRYKNTFVIRRRWSYLISGFLCARVPTYESLRRI